MCRIGQHLCLQLEKMQLRKFLMEQTDLMSKTRLGGSSKVGPCLPYGTANRHCCHCTGDRRQHTCGAVKGSAPNNSSVPQYRQKKQFKNTKWVGVYNPCSQVPRPTSCQSKFLATAPLRRAASLNIKRNQKSQHTNL